jgi:hypothetical protein
MGTQLPGVLDVTVDRGATQEEMRALRQVFQDAGIEATVRDDFIRLSSGVLPYVVTFIAPLTWVAAKFAGGAAAKAGADTWDAFRDGGWRGLRRFLDDVASTRTTHGIVEVRDPTGPEIKLHEDIPDEALRELADLDWAQMKGGGYLGWSERGWGYLQAGAPKSIPAPRRRSS